MDSSHVSLCAVSLKSEGFNSFRCDKAFTMGVNTPNLSKVLKCAGNDDVVTLKCEESTDNLTLVFESPSQDRISDFEFKLMDIESEHLGIPDTEYKVTVRMPASEFQRIIRDISVFGDTCTQLNNIYSVLSYVIIFLFKRLDRSDQRRHSIFRQGRFGNGKYHAEAQYCCRQG